MHILNILTLLWIKLTYAAKIYRLFLLFQCIYSVPNFCGFCSLPNHVSKLGGYCTQEAELKTVGCAMTVLYFHNESVSFVQFFSPFKMKHNELSFELLQDICVLCWSIKLIAYLFFEDMLCNTMIWWAICKYISMTDQAIYNYSQNLTDFFT